MGLVSFVGLVSLVSLVGFVSFLSDCPTVYLWLSVYLDILDKFLMKILSEYVNQLNEIHGFTIQEIFQTWVRNIVMKIKNIKLQK